MTNLSELTTVADDEAVVHQGNEVRHYAELKPDTCHACDGFEFRTLPRRGELLCRFATVNDLHFGEIDCGAGGEWSGPVYRSAPGDPPYPDMMNASAVSEIKALNPAAVLAKGDITTHGSAAEYGAFMDLYGGAFSDRLHHVRGNHDAYAGIEHGSDAPFAVTLPGAILAVLDTVIPGEDTGQVDREQIAWLDALAADADRPVLVFGHHQNWIPGSRRSPNYFGINPDDSEALIAVIARRPRIKGYFAGHTHRNRVRKVDATGPVPYVEVACVKDYPGSWAEYRVFEGSILQIHRRISTPAALTWSDQCRDIYAMDYARYALGSLRDRCFALPDRS